MVYMIFWSLYLLLGTGRDILRWSTAHAPLMTNNIRNMMGGIVAVGSPGVTLNSHIRVTITWGEWGHHMG